MRWGQEDCTLNIRMRHRRSNQGKEGVWSLNSKESPMGALVWKGRGEMRASSDKRDAEMEMDTAGAVDGSS